MFRFHRPTARPVVAFLVVASLAAALGVVVSGAATASSNLRASASRIESRETFTPTTKLTEVHVTARAPIGASGVKSAYVYGHMEVKPGEVAGAEIPCPRHTQPVSGMFSSNSPKVFLLESVPAPFESNPKAARGWTVVVINQDTQTAGVLAGAVCEQ